MPSANTYANVVGFLRPATSASRWTVGFIFVLLAAAALALPHGAAPPAVAAASPPALLRIVQNGGGAFPNVGGVVTVEGPRQGPATCDQGFYPSDDTCEYRGFLQGETVTLTARAIAPAVFKGWSDDRCPSGPVTTCSLVLADEQTVVALFSPLPITVIPTGVFGTSTVTITDSAGHTCKAVDNGNQNLCDSFELFSSLTLVASGNQPRWNSTDCDIAPSSDPSTSTCTAILFGRQLFNVGFGEPPGDDQPPKVEVIFRARKTGSGSGTIRGRLDCGSRCSVTVPFRESVTLVADAAAGSRFVRWSGGCGTAATCTLQATATSVAAEFETLPDTVSQTGPSSLVPPVGGRFRALVGKITTTGRGRRRQIQIPVGVNAPASARVKLVKGRRQVKSRRFSLRKGVSRLSLGVPARTRAGRYRLKLTIRDRAGSSPVRVTRTVRLHR